MTLGATLHYLVVVKIVSMSDIAHILFIIISQVRYLLVENRNPLYATDRIPPIA